MRGLRPPRPPTAEVAGKRDRTPSQAKPIRREPAREFVAFLLAGYALVDNAVPMRSRPQGYPVSYLLRPREAARILGVGTPTLARCGHSKEG